MKVQQLGVLVYRVAKDVVAVMILVRIG